jgi:hypothetical protein
VLLVLLLLEQAGQVALLLPQGVAVEHGPGGLEVEVEVEVANSAVVEGVAAVAAAAEGLLVVAVVDVAVAGNVGVHVAEAVSNPE